MSEVSTISSASSRMGPPGLAEPPDQRFVTGLEEDQHRVEPRHPAQARENLRQRRQQVAFAHVHDNRDLLDVAAGLQRQLRHRRDQRRRKIVHAEVPEIFERADRLRLPRSRQPREDDERLSRLARPACLA
jgi:hypothetical protein